MVVNDESSIYIPIPHYPPFKLRSSLIDKDPVIWVHLIESYIELCKYLIDDNAKKLTIKSQQQLQLFVKVYLHETVAEDQMIFSLGAINPDILKNGKTLRVFVFLLIKNYSLIKLNISASSAWEFACLYVTKNATTVRSLVDGSFKSKFNDNKKSGNISFIQSIHKHLEMLISNKKFTKKDLECLTALLGQQTLNKKTKNASKSFNKNIVKKSSGTTSFAEKFVTANWIEILEKLYSKGNGINADMAKSVMVVSLLSVSISKVASIGTELGISSYHSLKLYPLFSGIIVSPAYKNLVPGLEQRLPFLMKKSTTFSDSSIDDTKIQLLLDFFPQMTKSKATTILKQNDLNVEKVTNLLLENPEIITTIPDYEPKVQKPQPKVISKHKSNLPKPRRSVFDGDKLSKLEFSPESVIMGKKPNISVKQADTDLKTKTLSAALRLIYDSDEDEPDDTYDDQEKTTGSALQGGNTKISLVDDEVVSKSEANGSNDNKRGISANGSLNIDQIDGILFGIFKKMPEVLNRDSRKSALRKDIKNETKWSDEQIEGWARMIQRNPKRYKILEEKYFFESGPKNNVYSGIKKSSYRKERIEEEDEDIEVQNLSERDSTEQQSQNSERKKEETVQDPLKKKIQNARKEKNKSSKANHNRKSGHDKKLARGFN